MLQFDYNKAMAQVRELRAIADEMEKNQALSNAIEKVKVSWEGQTSNEFQAKCGKLAEIIKKEVANIRKVATNLETSAKTVAEAERAAQAELEKNAVRKT